MQLMKDTNNGNLGCESGMPDVAETIYQKLSTGYHLVVYSSYLGSACPMQVRGSRRLAVQLAFHAWSTPAVATRQ
jgi:hypothetical protein